MYGIKIHIDYELSRLCRSFSKSHEKDGIILSWINGVSTMLPGDEKRDGSFRSLVMIMTPV
jgi:hypothetical protein